MSQLLNRPALRLAFCAALLIGSVACEPDEYDQFESNGGTSFSTFTSSGCRYAVPSGSGNPVITWGNGTGATPSSYTGLLNLWASHGFITVASTSTSTGSGIQMRQCGNAARGLSSADPNRYGASGHSQGGGGTLNAAEDDPAIDTTVLVQPDIVYTTNADANNQTSPILYLGGSSDFLAPPSTNGNAIYSQADVPLFWAVRDGASHFEPVGSGTNDYSGISTAWFYYQLKPNSSRHADAASLFQGSGCGICEWDSWEVRRKNSP